MRLKGTSSDGVTVFSCPEDPDELVVGPKGDLSSRLKNVGTVPTSSLTVVSGGVSCIESSKPHHSAITEQLTSSVVSVIGPLTARPGSVMLTIAGGVPAVTVSASRNVVPVGAVLSLSGAVPLVLTPRYVAPDNANLTITGGTPVVTVDVIVTPGHAALSLTGGTPGVLTPVVVTPSGASLTLIGSHPALGATMRPSAAALAISGGAPAVSVSDNKIAAPTALSMTITGGTPVVSLSNNKTVTPSSAVLTVTGAVPVVSTPRLVTPTSAAFSITGSAPGVSLTNLVAPSGAALSITGGTPTIVVSNNITVTPSGASLAVTAGTPIVSTPRLVTPTGAALTVTGATPVIGLSDLKVVTPTGAALTITGGTPVVSVSNNKVVTPAGAALSVTGSTPTIVLPRIVTPSGATLSVTGGTPVVSLSNNKIVTPSGAALSVTGGTPTVTLATTGPSYDATGTGAFTAGATSISWTHTATAGAYVVVGVSIRAGTVTGVTYGTGNNMTLLGSIAMNNSSAQGSVYLYGIAGVSSSATAVKATLSAADPASGNSVSYLGVTSVGTAQTVFGSGTSMSQSTTGGGGGNITVQVFGNRTTPTISSYSGTSRYNSGANGASEVIGDSSTANTTFTATNSASNTWGGVAVVLS